MNWREGEKIYKLKNKCSEKRKKGDKKKEKKNSKDRKKKLICMLDVFEDIILFFSPSFLFEDFFLLISSIRFN